MCLMIVCRYTKIVINLEVADVTEAWIRTVEGRFHLLEPFDIERYRVVELWDDYRL